MSKAEGNEHLKAGRHEAAAASYTAALDAQPPPSDEEKAALLANRALAHLKLAKNDRCVADCTAVLQLQPRYVKALYRRAQAREALGELAEALKDVHEVLRIDGASNKEAAVYAGRLRRAIEARAATGDLSTPTLAVAALSSARDQTERVNAVGKLSRIAEDASRASELLHAGAVAPLLALLPEAATLTSAEQLEMPLLGLAVEALERMSHSTDAGVRRALADPPPPATPDEDVIPHPDDADELPEGRCE